MIKIKQEIKFYGKIKKNIWWNKFKMIIFNILKPPVYSTDILADGEKYQFNDQYKVYLLNSKLGDLNIKYEQGIETWMVHAEFKHSGKTEFILESDCMIIHIPYIRIVLKLPDLFFCKVFRFRFFLPAH